VGRPRSSASAGCAAAAILLAAALTACGQGDGGGGATTTRASAASRAMPAAAAPARPVELTGRASTRVLSHPGRTSHYGFVDRRVRVHAAPRAGARVLGRLSTRTPDRTDELVLVLRSTTTAGGRRWLQVRTPLKPAGTTGWIRQEAVSDLVAVRTWLIVDRRRLRARLVRDGRVVFRAPVAVGKPSTPTPAGRFYVRDKLVGLPADGLYGPIAFGTSASSDQVTDWPGGSIVGIHGTDEPERIPGHVSHGCVRLRNEDVRRLSRIMPVGTPVTIR
jgi:hypothetical protein